MSDKEDGNLLDATYDPCYEETKRKKRKTSRSKAKPSRQQLDTPKTDDIHTDSVLVSFTSLTKKRKLPIDVQKKISI